MPSPGRIWGAEWVVGSDWGVSAVSIHLSLSPNISTCLSRSEAQHWFCPAQCSLEPSSVAACSHYTLNWRTMLARGIAVVGPTVQLELDVQAMYRTHDTPTPPE